MKALTLTQPWASLVAIGAKTIETRSWSTSYRGPLAIHAAKGFPTWAQRACLEEPFRSVLEKAGLTAWSLPLGKIIAVVRLMDVYSTDDERCEGCINNYGARPHEREFGDFGSGRFAWWFGYREPLVPSIPCRGAQRLWNLPDPLPRTLTAWWQQRSGRVS